MEINRVITGSTLAMSLMAISSFASADWNPQPGWKDSYAVGGRCYCDSSNFDHNLDKKSADTPIGLKNVVDICTDIKDALGEGPTEGRIPFNDIQCGHGPANDAADEAACPGRVDIGSAGCDIKGPRWDLQAVYGDGTPTPTPTDPTTGTPTTGDICTITTAPGATLGAAKQQFEQTCPGLVRKDCDPISNNRWLCSTENIVAGVPTDPSPPSPDPSPIPEPEPAPTEPAEPTPPTNGLCMAQGVNLQAARQAYALSCPNIPRKDCDPTDDGQWICSSGVIGSSAPGGTTDSDNPPPSEPEPLDPAPTDPPPTNPTPAPPVPGASIGKVDTNDLVALHYDNCPDRDDGHALAAGKSVVVRTGLPNVMVVNGTCGDNIRGSYQSSSEVVAQAVWGNQWLDYFNDREATIQISAQRWADVLSNDGDVWVAEGGPSDFTANVIRSIRSQFPSLNLKRVHVVQHSSGNNFNEAQTSSSNIELIKRIADYITIPNGNGGGNGSAGLRNNSSFFVETARQSEFSNEWNAAFDYLNPNERLDFSDTVELLYMINDTDTQNVDDFARRYLR